jgi:Flp pilus assembly protein TadG
MKSRKMIIQLRSERGQALPLFALALVGLFAFTALAIDGGSILAERRQAQNVADNAAMSGSLLLAEIEVDKITSSNIAEAANFSENRAEANGYDNNGVTNEVLIGVTGPFTNNGIYYLYTVTITSEVPTTFVHLVYAGPLRQTVTATARVRPRQTLAHGYAMYGASEHECKTVWFSGGPTVQINGGGVFSNSDADSKSCQSVVQGGSGTVTVIGGDNEAVGDFDYDVGHVSPMPIEGAEQQVLPDIPTPDCSGLPSQAIPSKKGDSISPGVYTQIELNSGVLLLDSGIYCITGSKGFSANGGQVVGTGVLIYLQDGDFNLGGNTYVDLSASNNLVDASGNQWAGMLIYMDNDNHNQVTISGGSNSTYTGTIYAAAPASPSSKSKCILTGGGDNLSLESSQVICYSMEVTGDFYLNLTYNSSQVYQLPPILDIAE